MCYYHGSKKRIGEKLAQVIYDFSNQVENKLNIKFKGYCEPFVGMTGVFRHIPELFKDHKPKLKYKAGDKNESVILMWKKAQKGWLPPSYVSENVYNKYKKQVSSSAEKGYIGHQFSFGGQYFKGYFGKYSKINKNNKTPEDIVKISNILKDVDFSSGDYTNFSNLKGWILYLDPPYSKYSYYPDEKYRTTKFDTDKFWEWACKMSKDNLVFISEYSAPIDVFLVYSKEHKLSGININGRDRVENLYVMNPYFITK